MLSIWSDHLVPLWLSAVGRRKSWVVPIQLMSALMLLLSASWLDARLQVGSRRPCRSPSLQMLLGPARIMWERCCSQHFVLLTHDLWP